MAKHHIEHHKAEEVHHHHYKKGGKAHRAEGGRLKADTHNEPAEDLEDAPDVEEVYAGQGSNVVKEAKGERRKKGGRVHEKDHEAHGEKEEERMDKKPRRATGGRVGADHSPLSTAAKETAHKSPY